MADCTLTPKYLRQSITLKVRMPHLFWLRMLIGRWLIAAGAWVACVGIEFESDPEGKK